MRILITTGISPPDIGGPATYVPQVASALAAREHQITVVTLSDRLDHAGDMYPFHVVLMSQWICADQPSPSSLLWQVSQD